MAGKTYKAPRLVVGERNQMVMMAVLSTRQKRRCSTARRIPWKGGKVASCCCGLRSRELPGVLVLRQDRGELKSMIVKCDNSYLLSSGLLAAQL